MSERPQSPPNPWGDLRGVRPVKVFSRLLREGMTEEQAKSAMASFGVSSERAELCAEAAAASGEVLRTLLPGDICLYIGIPFCPSRCSYCSFVTHSVQKAGKLVSPFIDVLKKEIVFAGALMRESGLRLRAVYMGGGTPTTLTAAQLHDVFSCLSSNFDLGTVDEFTVEAGRPDTVDKEKLRVMKDAGANRVSINPQTFVPEVLCNIGRSHTVEDVYEKYALARDEGLAVNMDLIAGLPGDTESGFARSLGCAADLGAVNITVHNLAIKRGSRLNLEKAPLPDAAAVGRMLDGAASALTGGGYRPYYLYRQKRTAGGFENVGWSKPGHESIYNICIMEELCGILSLGGGGVTKMVDRETGYIVRTCNPKYPYEYNVGEEKILDGKLEFFRFYSSSADRKGEQDVRA